MRGTAALASVQARTQFDRGSLRKQTKKMGCAASKHMHPHEPVPLHGGQVIDVAGPVLDDMQEESKTSSSFY